MNENFGIIRYMEMSGSLGQELMDRNFLRRIRAGLDDWERRAHAAKKPDDILTEYLGEISEGGYHKWPDRDLMNEVKSILLKIEGSSIVKFVARNYKMNEREAFWLCLGLALGGKVTLELLSKGIENIDSAISKR